MLEVVPNLQIPAQPTKEHFLNPSPADRLVETETLILVAVVIVLFEYALHLRGKIDKAAKEKFEEWKKGYLAKAETKTPEEQVEKK